MALESGGADFDPVTGIPGAPSVVAQTRVVGAACVGFQYDAGPDQRFVVKVVTADPAPLALLSGWAARLIR